MGGFGGSRGRFALRLAAVTTVALFALGNSAGFAAAKAPFSKDAADYIPATIAGKKTVVDERSTSHVTEPTCEVPREGLVQTPSITGNDPQDIFGGGWDCPPGLSAGTGFVVGVEAVNAKPNTQKLTKKALYTPPNPAKPGSVKVVNVKVGGKPVKVFVFPTATADRPDIKDHFPAGTVFDTASAEPQKDLFISATTAEGGNPVQYLTEMLKAGAGSTPRIG